MASSKQVLIVGGVAGGMSCATRLRRLDEDAKITVVDKGPYVSYANCGIPYALGGVVESEGKLHVQTVDKLKTWFNIDARTNTELKSIQRDEKTATILDLSSGEESSVPYDKLVLALGAESFVPPVEGVDSEHVFTLQTIPNLQEVQAMISKKGCHRAVVIGGGFIGLEAAENLRRLGIEVTIFEFDQHVFPIVDPEIGEVVDEELRKNGVNLKLNARVTKITSASGAEPGLVFAEGQEPVPADLVIMAVGIRSRTAIPKEAGLESGRTGVSVNEFMQTSDPDIYAVGDMVETLNLVTGQPAQTALAGPANRQGRLVADHISGKGIKYRGNLGVSVCQVFGKTVGIVGLSTRNLDRLGIKHEYVTVHPPQHAGCGKILGAQVVGKEGVDKRIDVFATAMRAGMTVEDLEHLELAYAPPYGAAKDAVNMAGFAASNIVRGDVKLVHAGEFASGTRNLEDFQIIDVRGAEEYNQGHLKGAKNIPLVNLRERVDEVERGVPTIVHCKSGYRSYVGYRILAQKGVDVYNLDGGYKSVLDGGYVTIQEA
ncbi:hypothetical protein CEP52_011717 [Fusarium oligoseptatum]|uniref:Rhodanese domain-containing protein n=1 Tax=Fusarium oligoseptatum TaxID=2604345 RepID=A0A428T1Q6_9HYPO|nr:hypothetical protein CEP52_011717 [Fusarium oligoseptatum]